MNTYDRQIRFDGRCLNQSPSCVSINLQMIETPPDVCRRQPHKLRHTIKAGFDRVYDLDQALNRHAIRHRCTI